MKIDIQRNIRTLSRKSAIAHDSADAMRLSQAALNLSNVLRTLQETDSLIINEPTSRDRDE